MIKQKILNGMHYVVDMCKYRTQYVIELIGKKRKPGAYVIMMHEITANSSEFEEEEYAITAQTLQKMFELLNDHGYVFCTPEEFMKKKEKRKILVSFDDAYEGVYKYVFPYMVRRNIPYVVFQSACLLNKKKYLTDHMIKEMLEYKNFYLGSHTVSHYPLHECSGQESYQEMKKCNEILREKFGKNISVFAYPYGALVTIDLKDVVNASRLYKYAYSTINTKVIFKRLFANYMIPRININEENAMEFVKKII